MQEVKLLLLIYADKLKINTISFIRSYPNAKLHPWLSETHILIKSQLPKFLDMSEDLHHIVFRKYFEYS